MAARGPPVSSVDTVTALTWTSADRGWHTFIGARYGFCGFNPTICLTPVDGYGAPGLLCI